MNHTPLVDTHAHLYSDVFQTDMADVVARARAHAAYVLLPNIDRESIEPLLALAAAHPDLCYPMMGLHPCYISDDYKQDLAYIERLLPTVPRLVAIGEAGTDLYWDKTKLAEQLHALEVQADWARNLGLPLVLHCRDSFLPTIELVEQMQDGRLRGVFHCFGGTVDDAKRLADAGFHIGIGGVVTYKKSDLPGVLPHVNPATLVLETDCPYLPPVPHRGQRNEPAYLPHIAQRVAEALGRTYADVAALTTANACRLFGLPLPVAANPATAAP